MGSPILTEVGTVFIPVSNIEKARDWYCDILGLDKSGDIQFGHLYVVPTEGTNIVLDSKIYSEEKTFKIPAFHLNTKNVEEAFRFMNKKGVHLLTDIQHNQYFNFEDPDGNVIMVCEC